MPAEIEDRSTSVLGEDPNPSTAPPPPDPVTVAESRITEIGYTLPAARRIIHAVGRLQGLEPAVSAAQWVHRLCPCNADRSQKTDKGLRTRVRIMIVGTLHVLVVRSPQQISEALEGCEFELPPAMTKTYDVLTRFLRGALAALE